MSMMRAYAVALVSLLSGAAVVHALYKPDLTLPVGDWDEEDKARATAATTPATTPTTR